MSGVYFVSYIEVVGGSGLFGEVNIQGSKNAILPILAASVLHEGITKLNNCPKIEDVFNMIKILKEIGCVVTWEGHSIIIDATKIESTDVSEEYVREMRCSIILLGALLSREKKVTISYPGGCCIGSRPIDYHLKGLKKLGAKITETNGIICCSATEIIGNDVSFDFPSVGATENIILAAIFSKGTTSIIGAAKEPEIVELCHYLNSLGADISGAGTDRIVINGVTSLHDTEYDIAADRIVAGTYMAAVAGVGGEVTLKGIDYTHLYSVISVMEECGCEIDCQKNSIKIKSNRRPKEIDVIKTYPFPGFPTDMQSQMMSVLSIASGTSIIVENIFEARFNSVNELIKMGANILVEGKVAVIKGVDCLYGAEVLSYDLRGGAALVVAGLMAKGITRINTSGFIERGYEDICGDFKALGANIRLIPDK